MMCSIQCLLSSEPTERHALPKTILHAPIPRIPPLPHLPGMRRQQALDCAHLRPLLRKRAPTVHHEIAQHPRPRFRVELGTRSLLVHNLVEFVGRLDVAEGLLEGADLPEEDNSVVIIADSVADSVVRWRLSRRPVADSAFVRATKK